MGIIMVSENNGTGSVILQNKCAMCVCSCSEEESVREFVCRGCKTDSRSEIFGYGVTCYIIRNMFHLPVIRHFRRAVSASGAKVHVFMHLVPSPFRLSAWNNQMPPDGCARELLLASLSGTSQCVLYITLGTVTVKHTRNKTLIILF
jgi:hypothetical protein